MKNFVCLLLSLLVSFNLYAHSGNTDAEGCHVETETGISHCHLDLMDATATETTATAHPNSIVVATARLNSDGSTTLTTLTPDGKTSVKTIPAQATATETRLNNPCTAIYHPETNEFSIPCAKVAGETEQLFTVKMQVINDAPFTFVLETLFPH